MPTQQEYNVSKYDRKLHAKINLLNFKYQVVAELSGVVVGEPSYSIDANSDIRRTCSLSIYPSDTSFDISEGNKIWIDKYIQIYIGIEDIHTNEIVYTNIGIYIIDNPTRVYNATDNTITIKGQDLMAKMTGLRNGNLIGVDYVIKAGTNVRTAIISTIELAGFTKYVVDECPYDVPNEIRIGVGGTIYQILTELKNIYPSYQMYFDVDGVFHYNRIPTGDNEQIMVDDDLFKKLLIGYNVDTDFQSVKNVIEVYGKTHDIKHYGGTATLTQGNIYNVTISSITDLYDNLKIGFVTPNTEDHEGTIKLKINNLLELDIKNNDGSYPTLKKDTYYVVKYQENDNYFLFMGNITPYGYAEDNNPNSPFYINGTSGIIRIVLQGGEYDNIFMDSLAQERAKYELYLRCRLQDTVTLTCIPIYWLDVNNIIEITLPNKQGTETTEKYIVKNISTSLGSSSTQSIKAMKYYPTI